ncbi:MAG: hypothetical protein B7C24_17695 [Bacteroidetes bacterium 4572_77]|nr:MAG: hypothetical protein B7C24_17695 [Bacteroidetes bacterium 4572_77]
MDYFVFLRYDLLLAYIWVISLIYFMFLAFKKGALHFRIIKIMYPNRFYYAKSYFNPLLSFIIMALNLKIQFWYYSPFYFDIKEVKKYKNMEVKKLRILLLRNNKKYYYCLIGLLALFLMSIIG